MSPGRNEAFDFFFLINNDTEKESKELTVRSNRREKTFVTIRNAVGSEHAAQDTSSSVTQLNYDD